MFNHLSLLDAKIHFTSISVNNCIAESQKEIATAVIVYSCSQSFDERRLADVG